MHLRILTLLCYLTVLVLATDSYKDKSDIEDLINAIATSTDTKEYVKASEFLTPNVTFDPGPGSPVRPLQGRNATVAYLKKLIPDNVLSFTQATTQLIKFTPPYDKDGRSDRASALTYFTFTFFAPGNSTDTLFLFIKALDRSIVRGNDTGLFGGWKIENRELVLVVSFFFLNLFSTMKIVPRSE